MAFTIIWNANGAVEELKAAPTICQLSSTSSIVPIQVSEALSSSEDLDVLSIEAGEIEDSPCQSPAFEELMEVVTRAAAK